MNLVKNLSFFFLIIFFYYQSWVFKSVIFLLFSIILTSLYITIKLKNNLFKNLFLSISSIFLIVLLIESVFIIKEKKKIQLSQTFDTNSTKNEKVFKKNKSNKTSKKKLDKVLTENKKVSTKNKSQKISTKKLDNKEYFNYIGGKYFTKSKYGFLANPGNYFSTKYSHKGNLIYDVHYLIDQDGFRKTPQFHEYNNSSTLVNFYGGSFTFGEGANQNETLPAYFAKLSKKNIYVNNFGFHGWGVNNSLLLLENNLKKNNKQINILLTFKEHALRSACKPEYSNFSPKYIIQLNENKETYIEHNGICRQNFLPHFIYKVLKKSRFYNIVDDRINKRGTLEDEDVELYYELVKEFIRVSTKNNCLTIVGILPSSESSDEFFKTMQKLKINDLVQILDLRLYDFNKPDQGKFFFHHLEDQHPSPLAHFKRAKILLRKLNL